MMCYFGGGKAAEDSWGVSHKTRPKFNVTTFEVFFKKKRKRQHEQSVWAVVCFTVRKGSVCIAQYYASLLPPTLQRAKPSNAF